MIKRISVRTYLIFCKNCQKEILTHTKQRKYCDKKCLSQYRYKNPRTKKLIKRASNNYYHKMKHSTKYKQMKKASWAAWYARPENKEKLKLYYRKYQRIKYKTKPKNYKVKI